MHVSSLSTVVLGGPSGLGNAMPHLTRVQAQHQRTPIGFRYRQRYPATGNRDIYMRPTVSVERRKILPRFLCRWSQSAFSPRGRTLYGKMEKTFHNFSADEIGRRHPPR